ncbi:LytTR family transcriptional regulator DNA-binding domain-containing protein [Flocculibacter collagenilyticus]|uniref:LytTR family transcriptional regulator DNA-binding domain-containing protein n=1 Tax=Flocculibacter collagenilyticus TaxID=2744479 RepID=UPI003899365A
MVIVLLKTCVLLKIVKQILINTNLQTIEKALSKNKLIRCHKSYLVKPDGNFNPSRRTSADYYLALDMISL